DRGQRDEDQLEVDAEEVRVREAGVEAVAVRDVPDHLLVVREVPRRPGHAVDPLHLSMQRPGERDRGRDERHGGKDPPGLGARTCALSALNSNGFHAHLDASLSRDNRAMAATRIRHVATDAAPYLSVIVLVYNEV